MTIKKIKPIPKYMITRIRKADKEKHPEQSGHTRYYAYLTTNDKELVKVTVAVKNHYRKWHCKQCAVHGVHSEDCFVKDMDFTYGGGYQVGWYSEGITKYPKHYEKQRWECARDEYFDLFALLINKEYLSKFPEYKYSAYQDYKGVDILQYLRLYEKYPQTELMVKLGLQTTYIHSKHILNKVATDRRFRKWLSANRVELSLNIYYITTIMQAYKKNKPLKQIQAFEQAKNSLTRDGLLKPIVRMLKGDYERYFDYVDKQHITSRLYLDYLNACNFLGLDMSEEKNRYPHDFMRWHDIRIDEYATAKAIKDEEERKALYSKFLGVAEKYSALQQDKEYAVIIAKSPAELVREGEVLNHCVGRMNYDQKFIQEKTLIFFVRSHTEPDTPFVTVEYSLSQKKVLQCYAKGNTPPDDKVLRFINKKWLPYANKTLKQIGV